MASPLPQLQDIIFRTTQAYALTLDIPVYRASPLSPLKTIRDLDLMGNFAGFLEEEFTPEGLDIPYSSLDAADNVTDVALVISHLLQLASNNLDDDALAKS
jgi:hypothetical protein